MLIEHSKGIEPATTSKIEFDELDACLCDKAESADAQAISNPDKILRLFLVEDFSHDIIESLGSRFSIDPLFFREQLGAIVFDKDDPPALHSTKKRRQWFTIRNVRLRYHTGDESITNAMAEVRKFNVQRNFEIEPRRKQYGHIPGPAFSIISTQTTVWVSKDKRYHNSPVGIVLLDPTISEGTPEWGHRTNWLPMPDMDSDIQPPKFLTSGSWYTDIVQMTAIYPWFKTPTSTKEIDTRMIVLPALYTICAEWFPVCDYADEHLIRIEMHLASRQQFVARGSQIDQALESVSVWQRRLSGWRKMVEETLEVALPTAARLTADSTSAHSDDTLEDIVIDFRRILRIVEQLQSRVDRLQERGTTEMQIAAARDSLAESHDLARLTWLATIFIPLTFVSGLFSMTDDIGSMRGTFKTYFAAAVPVAVVSLVVARWGSMVVRWVRTLPVSQQGLKFIAGKTRRTGRPFT
jgi:hypothetical protein